MISSFIALFIVLIITIWISSTLGIGFGAAIILLIIALIAIIVIFELISEHGANKRDRKLMEKYEDPDISEKEKRDIAEYFRQKKIDEERLKTSNKEVVDTLLDVKYVGGHESYTKETKVNVTLTEKDLHVYSYWKNGHWLFTIPTYEIKNVYYGTSNDISTSKVVMFGVVGALAMKNNLLVVEYTNKYGVTNQVIFDTGTAKYQKFFNNLNAVRNKAIQNQSRNVNYFDIKD